MISISIVSILCSLYFLQSRIRYVTAASVFTAYVGNATDSASGYCNVDPIACNLRAAWNTCLSLSSGSPSECFIHVSVSSPLYIDSTLGALSLTIPGVSISIIGNNSTILSRTNSLGASRFIYANVSAASTLSSSPSSITLTNSSISKFSSGTADGGAIYFNGLVGVSLLDVQFSGNSGGVGGAVYIGASEAVNISNCDFRNNSASMRGGALAIDSSCSGVYVEQSYFFQNQANCYGGAMSVGTKNAGVTLTDISFSNNSVVTNVNCGDGGAFYVQSHNSAVSITKSNFTFNSAKRYGGSFYFDSSNKNVTMIGVNIMNSSATSRGGGGYFNTFNNYAQLTDIKLRFCKAITPTSLSDVSVGAGVYFNEGNNHVTISNLVCEMNTVYMDGGCIYLSSKNNYFLLQNALISKQKSITARAGGIYLGSNNLYCQIVGVKFNDNDSKHSGAALYVKSGNNFFSVQHSNFTDNRSGRITGGAYFSVNNNYTSMMDCRFENNVAVLFGAAVFYDGGSVANYNINLVNLYFDSNRLTGDGNQAGNGAALTFLFNNINISLANSEIINSFSPFSGGAMYIGTGLKNMNITNCLFQENSSPLNGGAISVQSGNDNIFITGTVFDGNKATLNGGAVYLFQNNKNIVFANSTYKNNVAGIDGGGFYTSTSNNYVAFAGMEIVNNSATRDGGGIYVFKTHQNVVLMPLLSLTNSMVVESAHPYTTKDYNPLNPPTYRSLIYSKSISRPGAEGFLLIFDPQTSLWNLDVLQIWDSPAQNVLYFNNTGPSFWPGSDVLALALYAQSLYIAFYGPNQKVTAAAGYWGFKVSVYPFYAGYTAENAPTIFDQNKAGRNGGGLFFNYATLSPVVVQTIFTNGQAGNNGGALYFETSNAGPVIIGLHFENNSAVNRGGAVCATSANYAMNFISSTFTKNVAHIGGAVSISASNGRGLFQNKNEIVIQNVTMTDNSANTAGAIDIYFDNTVNVINSTFASNYALANGGAISIGDSNYVNMSFVSVTRNTAGRNGGGVYVERSNSLNVNYTKIEGNQCFSNGGGIAMLNDTILTFHSNNTIVSNRAATLGGGIFAQAMDIWDMDSRNELIISSNSAMKGSAVAMSLMKSSNSKTKFLHNITFQNNDARLSGTFYWLYDSTMSQPPIGLNFSSMTWVDNFAPVGHKYATQAIHVELPSVYHVDVYDQFLTPALIIEMKDYYGNRIVSDNTTISAASLASNSVNCFGLPGSIIGSLFENAFQGKVTFPEIKAFCHPAGNISVNFEAQIVDAVLFELNVPLKSYYPSSLSLFQFRDCRAGEILLNGNCELCLNSYRLTFDPSVLVCTRCPSEATSCEGSSITLQPGYWRKNSLSESILPCPFGSNACIGGSGTSNELCNTGYTGPLCAVCEDEYYPVSSSLTCEKCNASSIMAPTFLALILSLLFFIVFMGVLYYLNQIKAVGDKSESEGECERKSEDNKNLEAISEDSERKERKETERTYTSRVVDLMNSIKDRIVPFFPKIKIIIATYQIVSSSASSFNATYPASFTSFNNFMKIFNFSFVQFVRLSCFYNSDYISSMMITTLLPIIATAFLFVVFIAELAYKTRKLKIKFDNMKDFRRQQVLLIDSLRFRYFSFFLTLTYIVLPSVTTSIFQIFVCQNVDEGEAGSSYLDTYMVADYSINCSSERYTFGLTWAIFMMFVYPIGIPLYYFSLLYRHKEIIKDRLDGVDENEDAVDPETKTLEFLYSSYHPRYWYFEVVETMRRLILTAIIAVIATGSSGQIVCSMMLSFVFLKVYVYCGPYLDENNGLLAEMAQYQIFFTYFGALITSQNLLGADYNNFVGVILILINMSVMLISFYFEVYNNLDASVKVKSELHKNDAMEVEITTMSTSGGAVGTANPLHGSKSENMQQGEAKA